MRATDVPAFLQAKLVEMKQREALAATKAERPQAR